MKEVRAPRDRSDLYFLTLIIHLMTRIYFQLIDFMIATHPACAALEKTAAERGISTFEGKFNIY